MPSSQLGGDADDLNHLVAEHAERADYAERSHDLAVDLIRARTSPISLPRQGCGVALEKETANSIGLGNHRALEVEQIGAQCDFELAIGGDGTMLGIGRPLAPCGVLLIGINLGRLRSRQAQLKSSV